MTAPDLLFRCVDEERRRKVAESTTHNGIDYLEVDPADQRILRVHFVHPLPGEAGGIPAGPALTAGQLVVTGGERITGIAVVSVATAGPVLTVTVDQPGDFSSYLLRLVDHAGTSQPPAGFDPLLAAVPFSFKVNCPNPFDCRPAGLPPPPPAAAPVLDYLVKDYQGFRQLMLDRLGTLLPDWTDRNPADPVVALVELLAHTGDQLSWFQDAVATEAYLGTARSRISLRRHARLLDYPVAEGCNARTWVAVDVAPGSASDGLVLPAGTPVLLGQPGQPPTLSAAAAAAAGEPVVFETMHPLPLHAGRSRIAIHPWSAPSYCLPEGATSATLVGGAGLLLGPGDVLLFQETAGQDTGRAADADPAHRQAVRLVAVDPPQLDPIEAVEVVEVRWHEADALRFPLWVAAPPAPGEPPATLAEVRGNLVLADHGRRVRAGLPVVPETGRFRPVLPGTPVSHAEPYPAELAAGRPAADAERRSAAAALPQVTLLDGDDRWQARRDLLSSDGFDRGFVLETERDGTARLRFGDDRYGRRPVTGAVLTAEFRVGNGPDGNVGQDRLRRLVWEPAGVTGVSNPLAGTGGTPPESVAQIRQFAPQAFRVQLRAVTEPDWEEVARRHPEVQGAKARIRWTGSWYTVYLTIDRRGGGPVRADPVFLADLREHLDRFRIAGYDLEVTGPVFVPLELALTVCVAPGYFRSDVAQALLAVFSSRRRPDGRPGFFAPDNFTFGQPLYLSQVYREAMRVAGVRFVEITACHRYGRLPAGELTAGYLATGDLEVIRLDNDPSRPERGQLTIELEGGL
jgi:hypothetical protein